MSLSHQQKKVLKQMGITLWKERENNVLVETEEDSSKLTDINNATEHTSESDYKYRADHTNKEPDALTQNNAEQANSTIPDIIDTQPIHLDDLPKDWSQLIDVVSQCQNCDLHQSRTQTVFGVGNTEADWMIIGEAPGVEEDHQGEPFIGRAGQLLNKILSSIGLQRNQVYIANSVKCRPPNNRDPKNNEMSQCRSYLDQQIALVNPKVIVCVGRIASQNLLTSQEPLSRLRNQVHSLIHPGKPEKNIPVIVTYHPAYLLRSPSQKAKVWEDLKMAVNLITANSALEN